MQTAVVPPEGGPGIEERAWDFFREDFLKYGIQSKRGEPIDLRRTYAFLDEDAVAAFFKMCAISRTLSSEMKRPRYDSFLELCKNGSSEEVAEGYYPLS